MNHLQHFQDRMEFHRQNFHAGLTAAQNKAGDKIIAFRKYNNKLKEREETAWKPMEKLRSDFIEEWKDNKDNVLEVWMENYIEKNQCTEQQVEELAEYFGYAQYFNEIHGISFYRTLEDVYSQHNDILQADEQDVSPDNGSATQSLDTSRLTKIDFIKLAYGLHHSGLMKAKSGNVTDTVNELAAILEFPLSEKWDVNLVNGIDSQNADFNHFKVFDKIRSGFEHYLQERTEKREKSVNKNKKSD